MKILIYGINYHPELIGIGKYTGELAEWLAKKGHDVRVITAPLYYPKWKLGEEYSSFLYRKEVLNGVEVIRCPLWIPGKLTGLSRIVHLMSFGLSSLFAVIYLAPWRPHVVVNIMPAFFTTLTALLASALYKAKVWLHIQDYELDAAFNLGILKTSRLKSIAEFFEKRVLKSFDRVSTISNTMLRNLYRKGIDTADACILPNWVDTNLIFPLQGHNFLRDELGLHKDDFVALYSGNMGEKQGLDVIVDVARRMKNRKNIKFLLCGDGPVRSRLIRLAAGLDNVLFMPLQPQDKLNLLLNLPDLHILPQRPEVADIVMPSKLTGIFASGKPVIAIAYPKTEVARFIRGRGAIVTPGDIDSLESSIVWFSEHPIERENIGQYARAYAVDRFDKDDILTQFEKQLHVLVYKRKFIEGRFCGA
jgi:colanic acid biosynthesis glycosyl transferase WcaI